MQVSRRIRKGNAEDTRKNSQPPKLALHLLNCLLREDLIEEISGDLDEKFQKTMREKSPLRAHINYWYQVLNYLRLFALKKSKRHPSLLRNNIKVSWRHLKNQPLFSSVNIGGLSLGITACILISLFIQHELSFDKDLANKNIYRLFWQNDDEGNIARIAWNPTALAEVLKNEVPEIKSIARIYHGNITGSASHEVKILLTDRAYRQAGYTDRADRNTETFFEEGFIYADKEIIEILDLNVPKNSLSEPMTMVITQRKAEKYFPNQDPIGKLIVIDNNNANPYRIDAVVDNPPANSHLQYDFILTKAKHLFFPGENDVWGSTGFYTSYIQLHDNADLGATCDKMTQAAKAKMATAWSPDFLEKYALGLQPIEDVHLYSSDMRAPTSSGDILYVWIFGAIAIFILIIACINFINLSTAKSANRAKEVGLRKTVGSSRAFIINQFLVESIIYSVISFTLATIIAWILLPQFNRIANTTIEFPWTQWWFLITLISSAVVIGIAAGLYPAFYLSSFKPIHTLKGNVNKKSTFRGTLVVFQFTTSLILIISTIVIYKQIDFMLNRKPGFDKEQVLLLQGTRSISNPETLKQELLKIPGVENVSISEYLPVTGSNVPRSGKAFWLTGADQDSDTQTRAQQWSVDRDYVKTLGMKIVAGRDFNADPTSDSTSIIINKRMARHLQLEDPIGKQVTAERTWTIIGIVEDFNWESLRREVRPLALVIGKSTGTFSIRIATGDISSTVGAIENKWHQFYPNQSIRYTFLDDSFSKMYDDVRQTRNVFTSFAVFAMIVACLGLFALSAFMIEQRSKEISIRLLFGATVQRIFNLLTADFLKLILISIVFSLPIAVWISKRWLEEFHYRIELTWNVFVITGVAAIAIAILTVSYQTVRAALAKPVDKLRSD